LDNGLNWYQFDADYYDYSDKDLSDSQVQVGFNKEGASGGSVPSLMPFTLSPSVIELDKNTNAKLQGQWMFSVSNEIISEPFSVIGTGGGDPGNFVQPVKLFIDCIFILQAHNWPGLACH